MMTDPIADMLTRVRNGYKARFEKVDIPSSQLKVSIVQTLKNEGCIKNYKVVSDGRQPILQVYLKYDTKKTPAVLELKRISKPGRRIYVGKDNIPQIKSGLGFAILSTPRGILTDKEARKQGVGGELICSCW
ncbi:MAG: 30S ribosomal protein S8 [Proteobacteria bacterium]|nr:30S ribosomal protein S8 [Pseudomonadota bacterium]